MRIILVDDEQPALDELNFLLGKHKDTEIVAEFTDPNQALDHLAGYENQASWPDAVFLDIDMPFVNGLETALKIQALNPNIIIIFVTAYSSYALESFQVHPLDYLLKPVKENQLNIALEQIRKQIRLLQAVRNVEPPALRITCFGLFKLWTSGSEMDIKWGTRRVRDLFMYFIDRGGLPSSRREIIQAIFGGVNDKKTANNLYVTLYKLRYLLHQIDPEGRHLRLRDNNALEIAAGVCDYRDFMSFAAHNAVLSSDNAEEAAAVLSLCQGNYLEEIDYWWADQTARMVDVEYERITLGLAETYISNDREKEAEQVLLQLISRNPLAEEGYCMLLDLYIHNGNHQNFKVVYKEYARLLKKEMGDKPAAKYTRHYKSITQR